MTSRKLDGQHSPRHKAKNEVAQELVGWKNGRSKSCSLKRSCPVLGALLEVGLVGMVEAREAKLTRRLVHTDTSYRWQRNKLSKQVSLIDWLSVHHWYSYCYMTKAN